MSFFAVLFALLLEQVKPLPRRNAIHDALTGWMDWTATNFDAGRDSHAWVVWCVTALAPALLTLGIFLGLDRISGLLGLAFDVGVLYLTLGFRQFSHYFTDIRAALDRSDEIEARRLLSEWRHLDASELPASDSCAISSSTRCSPRTAMFSASSSGSCCCPASGSGRPARCSTAWPNSPAATGRTGAAPVASPSMSG